MDSKKIAALIGVLFGVVLIVAAVTKPSLLWNHDLLMSIRRPLGDLLAMLFIIGAGVAIIGSSLLGLKRAR